MGHPVIKDPLISIILSQTPMIFTFKLFLGNALLRRLVRIGVLDEGRMKLDYVLGLKIEDFLERRLQTQVGSDIVKMWQLLSSIIGHPPPSLSIYTVISHVIFGNKHLLFSLS